MSPFSKRLILAAVLLAAPSLGAQAFSVRTADEINDNGTPRYNDPESTKPSFGGTGESGQQIWRNTEGSLSFGMEMQSGNHPMQGYSRSPLMNDNSFLNMVPRY